MKNSAIAFFSEGQNDHKVSWFFTEPFSLQKIPKLYCLSCNFLDHPYGKKKKHKKNITGLQIAFRISQGSWEWREKGPATADSQRMRLQCHGSMQNRYPLCPWGNVHCCMAQFLSKQDDLFFESSLDAQDYECIFLPKLNPCLVSY